MPGALGAYVDTLDFSGVKTLGGHPIISASGPKVDRELMAVYPQGGVFVNLDGPNVTVVQAIALMTALVQ